MSLRSSNYEALIAKFLHEAIEATDIRRMLIILREENANPNFILDDYGISPFHFVIGNESKKFAYEATKLILQFGGDPNVRSEDGLTPVHIATTWNRKTILHLLLKSGGDPFLKDDENKTAIDYAREGGLIKILELLNYHGAQQSESKKVYLYRDNVRAEYSARPFAKDQKYNKRGEEVFRYPANFSSTESSGSEVSITHSIRIPANGTVKIESSVKSDDDRIVKHQHEVVNNNIKRTISTYLKDCQVYECVNPGGSNSHISGPSPNQVTTPARSIKSSSCTPNHKTPSSENFSSLCNNLAKELNQKLKPPELCSRSALNVSSGNKDLFSTCLTDLQELEAVSSYHNNANLEPCQDTPNASKKCVRNIFINECNTDSPSRCFNRQNFPCQTTHRGMCKNCEDILCSHFQIICYHLCDSDRSINDHSHHYCDRINAHNLSPSESLSCKNSSIQNNQTNLIGFEKIEKNQRSERLPLKPIPSSNQKEIEPVERKFSSFSTHSIESGITKLRNSEDEFRKCSTSNNKNVKVPANPNFIKNRAKLEEAFLKRFQRNTAGKGDTEAENNSNGVNKSATKVNSILQECNAQSLSATTVKSSEFGQPPPQQNGIVATLGKHANLEAISISTDHISKRQHFNNADSQINSISNHYKSMDHQTFSTNESSGDHQMLNLDSPKKCNICDYNKENFKQIDGSQFVCKDNTHPLFLTCDSSTCSEAIKNQVFLPVSLSPTKLSDNCVELHFEPDLPNAVSEKSDGDYDKEISPLSDNHNKSSSTLETVIKISDSSNNFSSYGNKVTASVQPVTMSLSSSAESLTNVSDAPLSKQSISPSTNAPFVNHSRFTSFNESREADDGSALDVAFCCPLNSSKINQSSSATTENQMGVDRNSCAISQLSKSELSSNQSEQSDAFFSSSERCSPYSENRASLTDSQLHRINPGCDFFDILEQNVPESSSDYFSPNELAQSCYTSDEESINLFTQLRKLVIRNDAKYKGEILTKDEAECGTSNLNEHCDARNNCGPNAVITSDDEPSPRNDPEFNVCEEFNYVDNDKDIVFRETRLKTSTVRLSALNGLENLNLEKNGRITHELSDEESSETVSSVSSMSYDTDNLRLELKQKGYVPGPITFTTKRLYLRKLRRIRRNPAELADGDSGANNQNPDSFSQEVDRTINSADDKEWQNLLQSWSFLETKMSTYFATPTRNAKWRGGISKSSFTYLLLDPRVTDNLPVRSQDMSSMTVWSTFLKSIFYVGKGKRSRPYSHLYEAVKFWNEGVASSSDKINFILDLWKSNHGVVCLNVFQSIMPVEALTREAAMIEALGLKNLKNEKHGEFYGPCTSWSSKLKCQLGCFLLYRALIVFLADGERQLKPYDVD